MMIFLCVLFFCFSGLVFGCDQADDFQRVVIRPEHPQVNVIVLYRYGVAAKHKGLPLDVKPHAANFVYEAYQIAKRGFDLVYRCYKRDESPKGERLRKHYMEDLSLQDAHSMPGKPFYSRYTNNVFLWNFWELGEANFHYCLKDNNIVLTGLIVMKVIETIDNLLQSRRIDGQKRLYISEVDLCGAEAEGCRHKYDSERCLRLFGETEGYTVYLKRTQYKLRFVLGKMLEKMNSWPESDNSDQGILLAFYMHAGDLFPNKDVRSSMLSRGGISLSEVRERLRQIVDGVSPESAEEIRQAFLAGKKQLASSGDEIIV